jgi:hypothetical protein
MKLKHTLLALLTLGCPFTVAYSQDEGTPPAWGAAAKVTLSLTQTWTIPTLYQKDSEGNLVLEDGKKTLTSYNAYTIETTDAEDNPTKTVDVTEVGTKRTSSRYGNRELLTDLLNNGDLGEEETSIKGWSIVAFYGGIEFDVSLGASNTPLAPVFYARHTDKRMVLIEKLTGNRSELKDTTSMKVTTTSTFKEDNEYIKTSNSYSSSYKGLATLKLLDDSNLTGIISGKESYGSKKYTYYYYDDESEKEVKSTASSAVRIPGSVKFDKLVGSQTFDNGSAIVEGSLSISASSVVDSEAYLAGPEEEFEEVL